MEKWKHVFMFQYVFPLKRNFHIFQSNSSWRIHVVLISNLLWQNINFCALLLLLYLISLLVTILDLFETRLQYNNGPLVIIKPYYLCPNNAYQQHSLGQSATKCKQFLNGIKVLLCLIVQCFVFKLAFQSYTFFKENALN